MKGTFYHTDKNNCKTELKDLGLAHLKNIVAFIERRAKGGLVIRSGGGTCAEDMWMDENVSFGKKVLKHLNYKWYKAELDRRTVGSRENDFFTNQNTLTQCHAQKK